MTRRHRRRRRWWPQSVRVRLTLVATLVVRDRLQRGGLRPRAVSCTPTSSTASRRPTSTSSTSSPRGSQRGDLQPPRSPSTSACYVTRRSPQWLLARLRRTADGYEAAQREIDTHAGRNITLVAQQSLAEVNRTVDTRSTDVLLVRGAGADRARRARGVVLRRSRAPAGRGDPASRPRRSPAPPCDRRVPEPDTDDEVGRLARTMNAMLDRLESSSQRQRQFVSDASHELRSPLASIRTNLEVALRNSDRADWPVVAERALAEDERMEDTVSELLDARPPRRGRRRRARRHAPRDRPRRAGARRHRAATAGTRRHHPRVAPAGCTAAGSSSTRVVRNLLDNAARHATSAVAVELRADDDRHDRAHRRRRRAGHPRRRPRAGVRPLHPARRRSGPRRRWPRARPLDGQGDRRAARRDGDDRRRPDRRCPPARAAPRRLTPYGASMPELTIASFNCHAGLQARRDGVCEPYDLDRVLLGIDADVIVCRSRGPPTVACPRSGASVTPSAPRCSSSRSVGPSSTPGRTCLATAAGSVTSGSPSSAASRPRPRDASSVGTVLSDPTPERGGLHVVLDVGGTEVDLVGVHLSSRLPYGPPIQLRRLPRSCHRPAAPASSPATATSGVPACSRSSRAGDAPCAGAPGPPAGRTARSTTSWCGPPTGPRCVARRGAPGRRLRPPPGARHPAFPVATAPRNRPLR